MRDESPGASLGLLDSLKRLAASLLAISYTRLELLSTELEENRERLVSTLVLLLIALFCLGVGVVLITILLVVAFWD
ncbi:MAG: phage holin family protein, partial [Gallionellaceae bacterium]